MQCALAKFRHERETRVARIKELTLEIAKLRRQAQEDKKHEIAMLQLYLLWHKLENGPIVITLKPR